jgi:tRNA (adenine57-N1/adenine58-N1)-methyltransferase
MLHSRVHIEAGDLVIVYMVSGLRFDLADFMLTSQSRDNMVAITITPGEVFHNKYGRYPHDDFIGVKFGSKVRRRGGETIPTLHSRPQAHSPPPHAGYIYLLPTPELWTLSLPHRTQILYTPDIAYITMRLGVRVGGTVIEAGTGSGSMTHSLARTVGPKGDVRSFEYHRVRYEKARWV